MSTNMNVWNWISVSYLLLYFFINLLGTISESLYTCAQSQNNNKNRCYDIIVPPGANKYIGKLIFYLLNNSIKFDCWYMSLKYFGGVALCWAWVCQFIVDNYVPNYIGRIVFIIINIIFIKINRREFNSGAA